MVFRLAEEPILCAQLQVMGFVPIIRISSNYSIQIDTYHRFIYCLFDVRYPRIIITTDLLKHLIKKRRKRNRQRAIVGIAGPKRNYNDDKAIARESTHIIR